MDSFLCIVVEMNVYESESDSHDLGRILNLTGDTSSDDDVPSDDVPSDDEV